MAIFDDDVKHHKRCFEKKGLAMAPNGVDDHLINFERHRADYIFMEIAGSNSNLDEAPIRLALINADTASPFDLRVAGVSQKRGVGSFRLSFTILLYPISRLATIT